MFGQKFNPRKEFAGVIKQIESGERIPPNHDIPRSIREPGEGFEGFRSPAHDIFFEDFRWCQMIEKKIEVHDFRILKDSIWGSLKGRSPRPS